MSRTNISTLIVDTQAILSPALSQAQSARSEIRLVGMAQNYREAEKLVAQLSPSIIWLNLNIGYSDGIAAIHRLKELAPTSHILAITSEENEQEAFAAIMAGAQGYRSRDTIDPEEIPALFQMLLQDEYVIRPELLLPLMQHLRAVALSQPVQAPDTRSLQFISQDYHDRDTGKTLHIVKRTFQKLVQWIMNTFDL